jgi:hypothetical protein
MPPNDQAPRYQLVDPSTGDVVGSVFGDGNGNVEIQDETGTPYLFPSSPSSGTDVARFQDLPSDTRTDISNGGTTVVSETTDIDFTDLLIASDDTDGTGSVAFDDVGYVVEYPQRFDITALDDTESREIPLLVDDTETLEVYRWGAFDASDGTAPTGLDVELVDGNDTVQASANTVNDQSTSTPVASFTNSSGSTSVFKLRVNNTTGSAINSPGVGANFGWQIA